MTDGPSMRGITDFTAFYRQYAPDVYRFARGLSGDHDEAQDITSETFVRVWATADDVEMRTVRGYLLTIARNLFLQGLRKHRRNTALTPALHDGKRDPYAMAEARSEIAAVNAQVMRLNEIDRAALVLRTVNELSYAEIAHVLRITVASAKVKVHRARLLLASWRTDT